MHHCERHDEVRPDDDRSDGQSAREGGSSYAARTECLCVIARRHDEVRPDDCRSDGQSAREGAKPAPLPVLDTLSPRHKASSPLLNFLPQVIPLRIDTIDQRNLFTSAAALYSFLFCNRFLNRTTHREKQSVLSLLDQRKEFLCSQ